jgi:hypothetical protein
MGRKAKKKNQAGFYLAVIAAAAGLGLYWHFFGTQKKLDQPLMPVEAPAKEVPVVNAPAKTGEKTYSMAGLNDDIKKLLVAKLLAASPVYREMGASAINDARAAATDAVDNYSFAFDYRGSRYIVSADYTGGEHCCFGWYAFTLDAQNILNPVSSTVSMADMGNVYPEGEDNLVEKDGNLYLRLADDRLMYFCGSFQDSPMIYRYFQLADGKLVAKNEDFKEEFIKAAEKNEEDLNRYYNTSKNSNLDTNLPSARCRYFTERTANYLAANESGKAWDGFDALYAKLTPMNPYRPADARFATPQEIKTEIQARLGGE